MLSVSVVFPLICFLFLAVFFVGLPKLPDCNLSEAVECEDYGSTVKSCAALILIILAYAMVSFWNLGNRVSPQTFVPMDGQNAVFKFNEPQIPAKMVIFPGAGSGEYTIEYSQNEDGWFPFSSFSQDHVSVLKWHYTDLSLPEPVRYIRVACSSGTPWIGEIGWMNANGDLIESSCTLSGLCDEADVIPDSSSYLNSSYFDEIYHARTAWEHLNRIWPYEISHPPLGKELLSLGILLFGMTPFGWRFSGTLTGIMMLPVMYVFLNRLYRSKRIAACGTAMLAAGFMHFVQTRIATIDSYAVLFILLMYFFMAGWFLHGKTADLAACGICFGLGAACKWTCLYAGAGLAVLWGIHWICEFMKLRTVHHGSVTEVLQESACGRQESFRNTFFRFLKNSCFCALFFVGIPAVIYYCSYYPYGIAQKIGLFSKEYMKMVLDNQSFMFHYHATIVAEHPYSSRWYQWILNIRPILYYLEYLPDNQRVSIAAFVNPLICWGGLMSLPVLGYAAGIRKEKTALFLLVGYASGLIPWLFISRLTFEYHYFASAVFLIPVICYVFKLMDRCTANGKWHVLSFTGLTIVLFLLFFPVLSGLPVDQDLSSKIYSWLPSWPI